MRYPASSLRRGSEATLSVWLTICSCRRMSGTSRSTRWKHSTTGGRLGTERAAQARGEHRGNGVEGEIRGRNSGAEVELGDRVVGRSALQFANNQFGAIHVVDTGDTLVVQLELLVKR